MTNTESASLFASITNLLEEEPAQRAGDYLTGFDVSVRDDLFWSRLLGIFVHQSFSEEEAVSHWQNIVSNARALRERLGRAVGIHLAIVDYFVNQNPILDSPMLVEINVFRQTERLAMVDGLTGLFNRRYMDLVLKKEYNRAGRYAKEFAVCILDIDNFKTINDTKGHLFGDQVLKAIASLLTRSVRGEDVVCRYGGEEFLIVLPETDGEGALILVERIRQASREDTLFAENGITFSAGIASWPSVACDIDRLLLAADSALYEAKDEGKDRVVVARAERRRFGRYAQNWELEVFQSASYGPLTGIVTQNVSLGGVQFEYPVLYPLETKLRLVFTKANSADEPVEAEGHISWVQKNRHTYRYGVSFTKTPSFLEEKLAGDKRLERQPV